MKKLYVGNVPFQATEEELTAWFSAAGVSASSVTLVRDCATGQPRGFGFVEVQSDEEADKGIATLNGKDFLGRPLVVNEARPARDRGPGGGGGGGGRGRGPGGGGGRGGSGGGGGGGGRGREW